MDLGVELGVQAMQAMHSACVALFGVASLCYGLLRFALLRAALLRFVLLCFALICSALLRCAMLCYAVLGLASLRLVSAFTILVNYLSAVPVARARAT